MFRLNSSLICLGCRCVPRAQNNTSQQRRCSLMFAKWVTRGRRAREKKDRKRELVEHPRRSLVMYNKLSSVNPEFTSSLFSKSTCYVVYYILSEYYSFKLVSSVFPCTSHSNWHISQRGEYLIWLTGIRKCLRHKFSQVESKFAVFGCSNRRGFSKRQKGLRDSTYLRRAGFRKETNQSDFKGPRSRRDNNYLVVVMV